MSARMNWILTVLPSGEDVKGLGAGGQAGRRGDVLAVHRVEQGIGTVLGSQGLRGILLRQQFLSARDVGFGGTQVNAGEECLDPGIKTAV